MNQFTPIASSLGGLLLGIACSLLFFANGRILGISGIIGQIPLAAAGDRSWRFVFLAGLLTGGLALRFIDRSALAYASEQTAAIAVVSGLLVGFGTRLGNGCTSGHGLCGNARLSRRSVTATFVFIVTGALTVFIAKHVLHLAGGAS